MQAGSRAFSSNTTSNTQFYRCSRPPTNVTRTRISASATDVELTGPAPQRFTVAEGELKNIATAAAGSIVRAGSGVFALGYSSSFIKETADNKDAYTVTSLPFGFRVSESSQVTGYKRPSEPLIVYDDQSPNSLKVREAVCILDLDTLFKPCPEGSPTWQPELESRPRPSSSSAFSLPFMYDPNTGKELDDADEIVAYLYRNYGNNRVPFILRKGAINDVTAKLAKAPRKNIGVKYTAAAASAPVLPLKYWGYEASPFCVIVREALTELELQHVLTPTARGSPNRQTLFARRNHFQVPYLEDPNTGVAMFESKAIIEYLFKTYGK